MKAMAAKAREENERLAARIAALETQLGASSGTALERRIVRRAGVHWPWTMPARLATRTPRLFSSRRLVEFVALWLSHSFVTTTKKSPRAHQRDVSKHVG